MLRIFKEKSFGKWARNQLSNQELLDATTEMENGLTGDSLGSSVFKKRVASQGSGKSGSYRVIVAFRTKLRIVFLVGYAKNEKSTLTKKEVEALRAISKVYLRASDTEINKLLKNGAFEEIEYEQE